jgi:hypothetical protein
VVLKWHDPTTDRQRLVVGYVGEDGLLPDTPYRVVDGRFVACD